ncbi:MAG: Undecaprenyl-phosphate N-acetylglucosaminyl 1-phosphate transferase [Candidatus Collierbacteria bacterium GW2011_GWB1_45_35]|uniref:Undecaprenyl-phosphate N-acetylglucosaminyl 1-phosphate transferase n=1 Tax=Candidatus Collierbacteria bacterium GW2011_GWB2_45_17 TaxID=1618388 RepID=A0A837IHM1_9BACT|nr:MAG: Undecaprenyl-phosphate N-acetylglucosaminyl 1-phosphate transferase [Microgenomates group bacterium GW2011_GWC1_44_23]KKT96021.1 MAG: Undecaprenyl-phosphate N-acetylglucosaminyl 1-phosphate transferase [Candidatus Collierbacteria bacterium GW2011_GWA1_45_15]KKU01106.1 MAG: Undecaprenyl-phosphate N-acetylglucosaminyl 1-phosphate transferase [Candidatus Collierbacteria bacterium GW2011_GWB2_45_17]KKU05718.1 MAG: Undecaprenyl-phosphate N-acetylglucosaminyl 1-phosphate transferase [Candidatu
MVTPLTIWFFTKMGFVIDPKKSPHPAHIHNVPVPKGGGLAIFLAVFVTMALLLKLDKHLIAIALAAGITVVAGLIDDVRGMNPYLRLAVNFLAVGIIVASGIGIAFISNPFGGIIDLSQPRIGFDLLGRHHEIWILADLFALLWIPILMNAINWSSGVDGQISGVVMIAALIVGIISLTYSADITQWPVATLAFALAGAFAGLTVFHFYPQKIMPGYSATSLAGLLLGVISILATAKVGTVLVVLGVPLIDFIYLTIKRVASGKSPVWGDKGHLHHKLLEMGWGKRRVALFYWLVTAILGVAAVKFEARSKLFIMIGLVILMLVFVLWQYSWRYSKRSAPDNG